ncbi:16S rRNA (guanine(527)-N(7))-methyltransferase RsmG [Desulfurobacterium atlanticum]|uniref:Ribosomal RNA small subunit methyltransferase G n=1 Tax=Desulfurobacterium atlanticum TaxID=240169 RepID=A0A238YHW0_9BACT|nr:16S rRNA (guanine(527)-N(7))-methyltransferase RsmG [Desulfurobacterium atlanticum]SNR70785.1 16S rRNA m(7)G-527 methyltransferase [Desulfurobacterium atlanticum]
MLEKLCELNNIRLTKEQIKKFNTYKELLKKWGKRINITSILDDEGIETKHFFDSIVGIKAFKKAGIELKGKEIADVGSGGGFPGIPLAIMVPESRFTLIEPRHKRVVFLEQVKRALNLSNVEIVGKRVEEISNKKFDILTMRAVEDPEDAAKITKRFLDEGAVLCIYRGKEPFKENLKGLNIRNINLELKGVNFSRHFLFITKGDRYGNKN